MHILDITAATVAALTAISLLLSNAFSDRFLVLSCRPTSPYLQLMAFIILNITNITRSLPLCLTS